MEEVDINRSTFYLHYTDIYQMLESIEAELMDEVSHLVEDYPLDPLNNKESSYPFIEQIFTILDNNKDICIALLGKNGDMAFCQPNRKADCGYSSASSVYSFCLRIIGILSMRTPFLSEWMCRNDQDMALF